MAFIVQLYFFFFKECRWTRVFLFPLYPASSTLPTGNRWEVKGVTCRGSGLLLLACHCLITHIRNSLHLRGEVRLRWEPLQVLSKQAQISIHEHTRSTVVDASPPEWHSATFDLFLSFLIIISSYLTASTIIISGPKVKQISILPLRHFDAWGDRGEFAHTHDSFTYSYFPLTHGFQQLSIFFFFFLVRIWVTSN